MKPHALLLAAPCLVALLLAGCATGSAPPGTQVASERLATGIVPGRTTKAELLASFGATKTVVFDSGFEVWLYQSPLGAGRFTEFVVLVDPKGIVARTRQGATTSAP
jgi:hypothetical protein